jgi:hypothetical protein
MKAFLGVLCAILLAGAASLAQRSTPATSNLRATGLLEIGANGRARLVPIVIKVGDKFYDAGLYHATPRPLALDEGTVYEGTRNGDSVGLFTVTQAQDMSGVWVGLGQWRLNSAEPAEEPKKPEPAAKPEDADERPILRKPKPAGSAPAPAPEQKPQPPAPSEPVKAAAPKAPELPSPDSDPNRPILRRGKPTGSASGDELPPLTPNKPGASRSGTGAAAGSSGIVEVLPAVSDAKGPKPRPYLMQLNPEERGRYENAARQLAYAAVRKFAAGRPQHQPAPATALTDVQFKVYDAHYNNEPDFVLSASLPEQLPAGAQSAFRFFVTVVARVDLYGDVHQLMAQVTDASHLDAYPRLELIDIVDAEGTGSGQLLFRQVSANRYNYILYRIGSDKLWTLFEGAGARE